MADQSWPRRVSRIPSPGTGRITLRTLMASESILAVAGIGAWMLEADGRLWWSQETRAIHGVPADFEPQLATAIDFYAPEHRAIVAAAVADTLETGIPWDLELAIIRVDGQRRQVRARGRQAERGAGEASAILGTFEDVTDRFEAANLAAAELAKRAQTETLLKDVISSIPAALSVYDADERLMLVNENYRTIMPGNQTLMVIGQPLETIIRNKVMANHYVPEVSASDPPAVREAWVQDYLARHRQPGYSRIFHLANDRWMQASAAKSESGNTVSLRTDVSALKRAERELRQRIEEDALTGLANRDVLLARLAQLDADGRPGLLVLIDVDFFKAVNDGMGHPAGDLLLRLLARRLQRVVRPGDLAARLAGDEFALIAYNLADADAISAYAQRLHTALRRPMRLSGNHYTPSVSVGMAPFPLPRMTAKRLLANADAALYQAKRQGRDRHVLFDEALATKVRNRTEMADHLRRALAAGQIQVALQPQKELGTKRILGFEALARWQHRGCWVPTTDFVPLADDVGLALPLGLAVLEAALAGFAEMLRAGLEPGLLAVNVSTAQLLSDDFADALLAALARHGVSPHQLEVEVTETVLLDRSIARIGKALAALRALGVQVALDDFGTGYASLTHLSSFKVDRIKIDQTFVRAIDDPGADPAVARGLIARTLIGLGRGMGLDVIAEGVETASQRAFLLEHGCTAIQGWLVSRPMLPADAMRWLQRRRRMEREQADAG